MKVLAKLEHVETVVARKMNIFCVQGPVDLACARTLLPARIVASCLVVSASAMERLSNLGVSKSGVKEAPFRSRKGRFSKHIYRSYTTTSYQAFSGHS